MSLIRSEARKVRYTRSFRYLALGAIALAVLSAAASPYVVHTATSSGEMSFGGLGDAQMVSGMYAKAVGGYLIVVIMGVLAMAGEFRNSTVVATFLAAPRRASVLAAKLAVAGLLGIVTMLVSTAAGAGACWLALRAYPEAVSPVPGTFGNLAVIAVVSGAVLAVMGVAIGTLIRNQGIAIGVTLMWLFLVERLIVVFWSAGGKYLPTGLITGMMSLRLEGSDKTTGISLDTADYLAPLPATLLLLVYGAGFATLALATTLRRDVD